MPELVGLIPAAGRGVRAYPYTRSIPKSMLEVDGVPVLQRNVELLRDALDVREIRIVIGHHGEVIRDHFGDGSRFGVRIRYVENPRLDLELAYSIHLGGQGIETHCCVVLADECYADTNHRDLLRELDPTALVTLGLIRSEYKKHIRKNYVVEERDGLVTDLVEKPTEVRSHRMGTGTWVLHPDLFRRLAEAYAGGIENGPTDWTTWLGTLARSGERIVPFELAGRYVNLNSRDDLNYANYMIRDLNFEGRSTSLVYVVDDEHDSAVGGPIARFAEEPEIDEVVAVARTRTEPLEAVSRVDKVSLCIADDPRAPMGALVRRGLDAARGDLLLMSYSDDTFSPRDVSKILVYMRDADLVVGTRTTRQMVEQGSNMRGVVRVAHVVLAKLLQVLWWGFDSRFTDVGCIYRGLWRSTWHTIRDSLTARGVEVFPEMMIEVLRARQRVIEIPVNYYNRDLEFDHVRGRYQNVGTFLRIAALIVRKRLAAGGTGRSGFGAG